MHHVGGIESIVAQVVHHNLVGRKIYNLVGHQPHQVVSHHTQHGFAQAVLREAVGNVAYRAHGDDDVDAAVELEQTVECAVQGIGHVVDACHGARKFVPGQLVAIAHHAARRAMAIHHGGAEGDYEGACVQQMLVARGNAPVHAFEGA